MIVRRQPPFSSRQAGKRKLLLVILLLALISPWSSYVISRAEIDTAQWEPISEQTTTVSDLFFPLIAQNPTFSSISGRVIDINDNGLADVTVIAFSFYGSNFLSQGENPSLTNIINHLKDFGAGSLSNYSATTDENGNYTLTGLPGGSFYLKASFQGKFFAPYYRTVLQPTAATLQDFEEISLVDMVFVPAGEFEMGCDSTRNGGLSCRSDELPLHPIYLDDFYIDKEEVSNFDYAGCVAAQACRPPSSNSSRTRPWYYSNPQFADYSVLYVSWYEASEYCNWSGKRLPSEAEWEKAARGPSAQAYPWGEQNPVCSLANFAQDIAGQDVYCIAGGDTDRVGNYPDGASPYGALDMAGNSWEWVSDWYQWDYYSSSPYNNPTGPESGINKILRGGSFYYNPLYIRTVYRGIHTPDSHLWISFRCAVPNP